MKKLKNGQTWWPIWDVMYKRRCKKELRQSRMEHLKEEHDKYQCDWCHNQQQIMCVKILHGETKWIKDNKILVVKKLDKNHRILFYHFVLD